MPDHRQGNILVHSIQKTATQHKALYKRDGCFHTTQRA